MSHPKQNKIIQIPVLKNKFSQRTPKPTIRLVRPAKTKISLRIHAVWSESSLIACAFHSLHRLSKEPLPYWVDVQADLLLLITEVLL